MAMASYSMLVMYSVQRLENQLIHSADVYLSNVLKKGHFSIIPALNRYIKYWKAEYQNAGTPLQQLIVFSDRCAHDIWCTPTYSYTGELANIHSIRFNLNTTPSGEGKWNHDRVGGNSAGFFKHATESKAILFQKGKSPAGTLAQHANLHFGVSKRGDFYRRYHELLASEIIIHSSDCAQIDPGNQIKLRKLSCCCTGCLSSNFGEDCGESEHCGKWIKPTKMQWVKYQDASPQTNSKKRKLTEPQRARGSLQPPRMRKPRPPSAK